jgi:hypothetical protein
MRQEFYINQGLSMLVPAGQWGDEGSRRFGDPGRNLAQLFWSGRGEKMILFT